MSWSEVVMIMFSCVAANHLRLVAAVEDVVKFDIPIVNCPKCFTWWSLMLYGLFAHENIFVVTATSFLFAYIAMWVNLALAITDSIYNSIYDTIFSATNKADGGAQHPYGDMPDVSEDQTGGQTN